MGRKAIFHQLHTKESDYKVHTGLIMCRYKMWHHWHNYVKTLKKVLGWWISLPYWFNSLFEWGKMQNKINDLSSKSTHVTYRIMAALYVNDSTNNLYCLYSACWCFVFAYMIYYITCREVKLSFNHTRWCDLIELCTCIRPAM